MLRILKMAGAIVDLLSHLLPYS